MSKYSGGKLSAKRKARRKEKNYDRNMAIYARGTSSLPAEYMAVHQPSEPERVEKIKSQAAVRRQRRAGVQL